MTERIDSEYDEHPLEPPPDDEKEDAEGGDSADDFPDKDKDFSDSVPEVSVEWTEPPSFNNDPPKVGGGTGDGDTAIPPANAFYISLSSMRTAEESMLSDARTAVSKYEELRQNVAANKDTVFGQELQGGHSTVDGEGKMHAYTYDSQWAEPAKEFASVINPIQQKVLAQIASVLQATGEYIATLNAVGQMYAKADRKSVFPDPPANK
ncbi:hypothetical protein ITI46_01155 [Streptomyces oryzae]|uniref:Uncharacterized protein n=1 Tax=Streptomyces oryzae TaxID=1434886 RepID=A0ABS3X4S4_9ACTN|nr:hypothetical protein [Streptomyces oryzae]MBO8190329.1 hypothetical protein [Streptomyces oryzae]